MSIIFLCIDRRLATLHLRALMQNQIYNSIRLGKSETKELFLFSKVIESNFTFCFIEDLSQFFLFSTVLTALNYNRSTHMSYRSGRCRSTSQFVKEFVSLKILWNSSTPILKGSPINYTLQNESNHSPKLRDFRLRLTTEIDWRCSKPLARNVLIETAGKL